VAQSLGDSASAEVGLIAGQAAWSAGAVLFAAVVVTTVAQGRGAGEPWHAFALAGAAGWLAWAGAGFAASLRDNGTALVPVRIDDPLTWAVIAGGIANFAFGVQSRAVPVFFGRKPPSLKRLSLPLALLNGGAALLFVASLAAASDEKDQLAAAGLVLAGAACVSLAPIAGSCWGRATRLRPRARSAAQFVLLANWSAVVAGLLMAAAGIATLVEGEFVATGARDAARHGLGLGFVSCLIIGMAQLVSPFFAIRRVQPSGGWLADHGVFVLLATATLLRVMAGLLTGRLETEPRMHINATAGALAWLGLFVFAVTVVRAVASEERAREGIASAALGGGGRLT
jgi:hypothetical protein